MTPASGRPADSRGGGTEATSAGGSGDGVWRHAPRPAEDLALLSALTGLALMGLAWTWPVWGGALRFPCPFRTFTSIPCPTCGGTRALLAAARGELWTALQLNPLVAVATAGLLLWIPLSSAWVVGRWRRPDVARLRPVFGRIAARVAVGSALVNWLWVALSGTV